MKQNEALPNAAGAPVLLKTSSELRWPEEPRLFYLLGRDGLYLCRNHPFFRSCVKTARGPSGLEEQVPFLEPRFPRIPRALLERCVGFFSLVADRHGAEAAVLLLWDANDERVRLLVPAQRATVRRSWDGYRSPIGVRYDIPRELPSGWIPFGDIHSHVHLSAYSSATDVEDELHGAGMHVVVGRIGQEPPQFHVEAVVDGQRFTMRIESVAEGYRERDRDVPLEWLERVSVDESSWSDGGSRRGTGA